MGGGVWAGGEAARPYAAKAEKNFCIVTSQDGFGYVLLRFQPPAKPTT
jgi:hypothetical protein